MKDNLTDELSNEKKLKMFYFCKRHKSVLDDDNGHLTDELSDEEKLEEKLNAHSKN